MDSGVLLARQAIYDTKLRIHAYELLFRSHHSSDVAGVQDGDQATSAVLLNAFSSLPLEDVLEGKPAFVNFTRRLLDHPPPIDASRLVVEVLEDVVIDADTIAAIGRLKQLGYTIALDDYIYTEGHHELVKLADVVKIDVLANNLAAVRNLAAQLRPYGATLLAEKVETLEVFDACKAMGFQLFQGFFLSRPQLVKGRVLNGDQRTVLQLLSVLRKPDVDFRQIEQVIQTDSVLVYKVLRLVNSALFNLQREITSIRQALALLGLEKIRSLTQLLALSNLQNKPTSLFVDVMVRARLGQLLAERAHRDGLDGETQFTVGLLSSLDVFLGLELGQILDSIAIADNIKDAILERSGDSGALLSAALAYERADFDHIEWPQLDALGIDSETLRDSYLESLRWANDTVRFLR